MTYDRLSLVNDGGTFDAFTAIADGTVSGGGFVAAQSGTNSLGSTAATYATTDVRVNMTSTSGNVQAPIGLAIDNKASGAEVAILRKGDVILEASNTIVAGDKVLSTQSGTELGQIAAVPLDSSGAVAIGQAYTQGADGEFILTRLDL